MVQDSAIHEQVMTPKTGLLGDYNAVDLEKLAAADEATQGVVTSVQDASKKIALKEVAILPVIMMVCYLILIGYFKSQGGYKPKEIAQAYLPPGTTTRERVLRGAFFFYACIPKPPT